MKRKPGAPKLPDLIVKTKVNKDDFSVEMFTRWNPRKIESAKICKEVSATDECQLGDHTWNVGEDMYVIYYTNSRGRTSKAFGCFECFETIVKICGVE